MPASIQNGPKGPDVSRSTGGGKNGTGKAEKDSAAKESEKGAQGVSGAQGASGTGGAKTEPEQVETKAALENQTGQTQRAAEARAQIENAGKTPGKTDEQPETTSPGTPQSKDASAEKGQVSETVDTIADAITSVGAATRNPGIAAGAAAIGMGIRAGNDLISTGSYDMGRFGEDLASTGIAFGAGLTGGVVGSRAAGAVSGAGKGLAVGTENVVSASVSTSIDAGVNSGLETEEPGRGVVGGISGGLASGHLAGLQNILGGRPGLVGRTLSQTFGRVTTREIAGETATQAGIAAGKTEVGTKVASAETVVTDAKPQAKPAPKPASPRPEEKDPAASLKNESNQAQQHLETLREEAKSLSRQAYMGNEMDRNYAMDQLNTKSREIYNLERGLRGLNQVISGEHKGRSLPTGAIGAALGFETQEQRNAALDALSKASNGNKLSGIEISQARELSSRMEKEGWGFGDLMDTSAFNHDGNGGRNSSSGRSFSTNIADYGNIHDLSAFGGYHSPYGGGGDGGGGGSTPGDGSYGGGMANGDPTPG